MAVLVNRTLLTEGHAAHFGEAISPDVVNGAILTVISENGQRFPGTVSEMHAVKMAWSLWLIPT